ncbi:hypothetical protein JHC43_20415 [Marinobacter salarius]|nr:hypothetical protein [Marinobacter salarius]
MSRHSVLPTRISSKQVLSIVVPVFNERAMLPVFLERVLPILDSLTVATQLVFVDDGSEVRIPRHRDHPFRLNVTACSGRS